MTQLLVSVRSAAEAELACAAGADLIDVKEPARGPLGAADAAVIEAVVATVDRRRPVSAALGELVGGAGLADDLTDGVQFAKFGLAGCRRLPAWKRTWQAAIERLPRGVAPVGVAYADWQAAGSPEPFEVLALAQEVGCAAVLLDTFDKSAGPLTEHAAWDEIGAFIAGAAALGMLSVVAGGLDMGQIAHMLPLSPDYFGVRGAACAGSRTGQLKADRVRCLAAMLHTASDKPVLGPRG